MLTRIIFAGLITSIAALPQSSRAEQILLDCEYTPELDLSLPNDNTIGSHFKLDINDERIFVNGAEISNHYTAYLDKSEMRYKWFMSSTGQPIGGTIDAPYQVDGNFDRVSGIFSEKTTDLASLKITRQRIAVCTKFFLAPPAAEGRASEYPGAYCSRWNDGCIACKRGIFPGDIPSEPECTLEKAAASCQPTKSKCTEVTFRADCNWCAENEDGEDWCTLLACDRSTERTKP